MFQWWILKELSFWRSSQKEEVLSLWTRRSVLEVYLFCCSVFVCGTFKLRGNMRTKKKKTFAIVLSSSLVMYFEIWTKVCNLLIVFLQSLETCLLKVGLFSTKTPNNFLEELLFLSVSSILIEASSS